MKREAELRSGFLKELRRQLPQAVAIRHEDTLQSGTPDLSITLNMLTSWIEFKHATPDFSGTGLQELTCSHLAEQGFCRYVIWAERGGEKKTMIFHPRIVQAGPGRPSARKPHLMAPEEVTTGHNHTWLVSYIRGVHRC